MPFVVKPSSSIPLLANSSNVIETMKVKNLSIDTSNTDMRVMSTGSSQSGFNTPTSSTQMNFNPNDISDKKGITSGSKMRMVASHNKKAVSVDLKDDINYFGLSAKAGLKENAKSKQEKIQRLEEIREKEEQAFVENYFSQFVTNLVDEVCLREAREKYIQNRFLQKFPKEELQVENKSLLDTELALVPIRAVPVEYSPDDPFYRRNLLMSDLKNELGLQAGKFGW
jgi:hypothetical protein